MPGIEKSRKAAGKRPAEEGSQTRRSGEEQAAFVRWGTPERRRPAAAA